MVQKEKCIVIDLDCTLCARKGPGERYEDLAPNQPVLKRLLEYREKGFYIIVATSRNMQTYDGNVGKIMANTAKVALDWLERHAVPFDELHVGKPWQGRGGFYVDDKAVRPDEFVEKSYDEVLRIVGPE
jgi:capsule biosynthesis phosphatase